MSKINIETDGYFWIEAGEIKSVIGNLDPDDFISDWSSLKKDKYLKESNDFRYRRYGEFIFTPHKNKIYYLGNQIFYQDASINKYMGGIERKFSDLSEKTKKSNLLQELLRFNYSKLNIEKKYFIDKWIVGVHQIRIIASNELQVYPAPEGIHSDGHDYIAIHLINRENVIGGKSIIYDEKESFVDSKKLKYQWDTVILDDQNMRHEVTSFRQRNLNKIGYRDVLIMDFKRLNMISWIIVCVKRLLQTGSN